MTRRERRPRRPQSKRLTRRQMLAAVATLAAAPPLAAAAPPGTAPASRERQAVCEMLDAYVLERPWVEAFLDPKAHVWAKFDPELGYLLRNAFMRDGVHGSHTLSRYEATGQRYQVNFRDRPCRINTYGNSFTQGHQVSDGETWQEVLAAHFAEPIRNFGIGGFGVYQAYRRLLRTEATDLGAKFLIFNIWGDDHLRSVNVYRWLMFHLPFARQMGPTMFHSNPWAHARLDETTGALVEKLNPCPKPEMLYQLCDREYLHAQFADDDIVRLLCAMRKPEFADKETLQRLAAACRFEGLDFRSIESTKQTATRLYHAYAIAVGMKIVEKLDAFCQSSQKKLFVLLSYPQGSVWHACQGTPMDNPANVQWHPKVFQDFLTSRKIPFLDTLQSHLDDYRTFRGTPKDYVDRYYIGHYNPLGNHFFAYAVKEALVKWLDPKPPTYRGGRETLEELKEFLPG